MGTIVVGMVTVFERERRGAGRDLFGAYEEYHSLKWMGSVCGRGSWYTHARTRTRTHTHTHTHTHIRTCAHAHAYAYAHALKDLVW